MARRPWFVVCWVAHAHRIRYQVVIFSNQGGLTLHPDPKAKGPKSATTRISAFKQKCNAVLGQLGIPITLYAATGKDIFRKPRPGMWTEMKIDYGLAESDIDYENSVFVGDAGGRTAELKGARGAAKDFSCSDRNLAHNIGIPYQTPEEFFLGEIPRDFSRTFDLSHFPFAEQVAEDGPCPEKTNDKDIILFSGPPGAGKSTFYWKYLKPLGYERVNQDILKRSVNSIASLVLPRLTLDSKDKCFKAAADFLQEGDSVVVGKFSASLACRCHQLMSRQTTRTPMSRPVLSGSLSRANIRSPSDASGSERRCTFVNTTMPSGL